MASGNLTAAGRLFLPTAFLLLAAAPAAAQPPASIATIVQFHTVCNNCHEGECSGRLSFDSGAAAARSHIERHLETKDDVHVAALFAMLRHVKENCSHYPAVPIRPAVGAWEAEELAPWRNAFAGAYFIPLGQLAPGRRGIELAFDGRAEGSARIDDDRMETVADERLCGDTARIVEFDATARASYFLHLKLGSATLRRMVFR
jgi:hypothetical protein